MKQGLRLKVVNCGFATAEALTLARDFDRRKLVPLGKSLDQLVIRGVSANPVASGFGRGVLLALALERLLFACSADKSRATRAELERVLGLVPELKAAYRLSGKGKACTLTFRAPTRRLKTRDWSARDWVFIAAQDGGHAMFPFSGREFHDLLRLFSLLGGDHSRAALEKAFAGRRALLARFLRFCARHGLIEKIAPPSTPRPTPPLLRFVSHSCLEASDARDLILVDPVFFVPSPYDRSPGAFSEMTALTGRLSRVTGVFISHNHWDHLHLATVARLPRSTPIFVPRLSEPTPFNPSLADFFRSLGFTQVREVRWWETIRRGNLEVLIVPSYGEWFTPTCHFDAFTYLIKVNGKSFFGAVDSHRNDRGDMLDVLKELKRRGERVDCFCFSASGERLINPAFAGMPFSYSNDFYGNRFSERREYLATCKTVERWFAAVRPRYAIPYAEFIFHNAAAEKRFLSLGPKLDTDALFRHYWRRSLKTREPRLLKWREELDGLRARLRRRKTEMLMLGPGEGVWA